MEEELADLIKRALAEGDAAGDAGKADDGASAQWSAQSASAALHAMATRPGVPPEFAALLVHVHQAAAALAAAAAATRPQEQQGGAAADAAGKGTGQPTAKPVAPTAGAANGGPAANPEAKPTGASSSNGGGTVLATAAPGTSAAAEATAATAAAATAGTANPPQPAAPAAPAKSDNEEELVEDVGGDPMVCDVEATLQKLPSKDQEKTASCHQMGGSQ